MADIVQDQQLADQDLPAHLQTFHSFNKLVLFAILHIVLVLGCLALAFLGQRAAAGDADRRRRNGGSAGGLRHHVRDVSRASPCSG